MMNNQPQWFQIFLDLSVVLTGFRKYRLLGTGQAEYYYEKIEGVIGTKTMTDLLSTFTDLFEQGSDCDTEKLHDLLRYKILSDPKLGPVARNIILVWYIGNWYQLPFDWRENYGQNALDVTFVLSPISYTEGLLWPAIGAHPPGAKAPGFGTWGSAPVFEP